MEVWLENIKYNKACLVRLPALYETTRLGDRKAFSVTTTTDKPEISSVKNVVIFPAQYTCSIKIFPNCAFGHLISCLHLIKPFKKMLLCRHFPTKIKCLTAYTEDWTVSHSFLSFHVFII